MQQGAGSELKLRGESPAACLRSSEGEHNSLNKCQEGSCLALLEARGNYLEKITDETQKAEF